MHKPVQGRMITFRHRSNSKQIKIKTERELNERMSPWLQGIFSIKNPIVGFKVPNNKYCDTETFYANKDKFYGQVVDIIEANDQLEISFVSDNLNSSSHIRNTPQPAGVEDQHDESEATYKMVNDTRDMERRLQDKNEINILFNIQKVYQKQIIESISLIKTQQNNSKVNFYVKINTSGGVTQSNYRIYVGKKLVAILNLTREYKENILMVIERFSKREFKNEIEKVERHEDRELNMFRASFDQENEAPSFTTYQLQERLNQEACLDYLRRMSHERVLKKYEYLKLMEKCEQNFVQFYRIFCEGAIDNDYENFKNEILHKVENNLELLLSNVDEMDLSRPISREEQRRQNLKKSVSSIEIVKVQNYFEILDQLKPLLSPTCMAEIKSELLDQNQTIFHGFADYLSRKISKEELAAFLERAVTRNTVRPVSRCLPRSANRHRQPAYNSEDQIVTIPSKNQKMMSLNVVNNFVQQKSEPVVKEEAQLIKLVGSGGSGTKESTKNENKQNPPMFGSSKEENNFSPIKYMSDIESNYKQAWTRLEGKADLFEPEEYGLLYYYLQTRDDSISNHIQELEWNQQSSISKLKSLLQSRMIEIMEQNFSQNELDCLAIHRESPKIDCAYENFKYESDLAKFLSCLHSEISLLSSKNPSIAVLQNPNSRKGSKQTLTKKASDSKLLDKAKRPARKYSDENEQFSSPKQSSCSYVVNVVSQTKTNQPSLACLGILHNFWSEEFQEMVDHCNFTEELRQQYLRQAYKEGNPSVYSWINSFVQGKLGIIDSRGLKSSLRVRDQQNKYIMSLVPIFSQILRSFVEEGKITDKMRKWSVVELLQLNPAILGAFEEYIRMKCADEFVDTLTVAFQLQNSQLEQFKSYLKRIEKVLQAMSVHDEVGLSIFNLYPKHIRAICELYYFNGDIDELLDSLDMIHKVESDLRKIKVVTFNLEAENVSPFEYFDGSQDTKSISNNMKQILESEKQVLSDKLNVIGDKYKKNKMSIKFGLGMCEGETLLGKSEFCKKWREIYNVERPQQIDGDTEEIIQSSMLFDYYCYLSVVSFLYKEHLESSKYTQGNFKCMNLDYFIQIIGQLQASKLREYLTERQSKANDKSKFNFNMEYFMKNNFDVVFIQGADSTVFEKEPTRDFGWVKAGRSAIIYNKNKFGNEKTSLLEQYKQSLQFNEDSAIFFGDRGYLLLSIHLAQEPQVCKNQAKQVFKVLEEIYNAHPMIKIIVGIYANHFIGDCPQNFLNFAPKNKEEITKTSQKTYLQTQLSEAQKKVSVYQDFILANLEFKDYAIKAMTKEEITDKDLLLENENLFQHFEVTAEF